MNRNSKSIPFRLKITIVKKIKIITTLVASIAFTTTALSQLNTPMKIEFGIRSGDAPNGQSYSYLKEAGDFVIMNEIIYGGQGPNYRLKVINKMNGSITNIQNIEGDYDTSFQITEAVYNESQNAYYFGLSINNYLNQLNDSQTRIYKLDSNGLLTVMNSSVSNNQIFKIKKLYIKDNYLYSICTNKIQKIDISIFEYVEEIPLIITIDEGTIEYIGNDEFVLYKTIVNINNSTDIYLVKFNINGLVLWQKTISGSRNDFVSDLICLNGDLYLCGSTNSIDGDFEGFSNEFWSDESKTAWISKLDANSTLLWIKGYVSFENGGGFQSLLIKDNYIYASGNCHKYYNYYSGFEYTFNNNVKTVKLSLNGELLWEKTYGGFNNQVFHSFGVVNNQLVYTTNLNRYSFAGWNMFFYSQGDVSAEISGKFSNPLNFSENPNQQDIWIFGTDLDGIIQWNQFYGGESNDYGSSTIYNPQNIYIAANTKSSGYDVGDPIGYSDSWLFKLSVDKQGSLGLEDSTIDLKIKVYPNPTSQMLYVSHPKLNTFTIQISDLNGKQIYSGTIGKDQPLDVSNYTQGMYLVTIENKEANKINTYKIIKK
jgi:hypothetical protein